MNDVIYLFVLYLCPVNFIHLNLLYHFGLWLYRLIARLIAPFYAKAALFTKGHNRLIFKMRKQITHDKPIVWFHCASLGEFEQGRPIMEGYRKRAPDCKIVLTFFSPSGYETKKEDPVADWIFYLPLDTKRNARRFLNTIQPVKAIFIKYEFWYNYLVALKKRNISTYIVSATFRSSQPFFKWYGAFFRRMLRTFSLLFVQNQASKDLLNRIHFTNAVVAGDTRFDRVWEQAQLPCSLPVIEAFCSQVSKQEICVAGSTWPRDEAILVQALKAHPKLRLILVPHEVNPAHITQIVEQFSLFSPVLYSQLSHYEVFPIQSKVLVVDAIGLLSSLYRFGSMAYVGGGFLDGIHNIPEAAVYSVPVLFGPNYKKFNEAVDLIKLGGAHVVHTFQEVTAQIGLWLMAPQRCIEEGQICFGYVQRNLGATQMILDNML